MKFRKAKLFERKGQITIFIVLGIFILIIWGLVFFVSKQTLDIAARDSINKLYGDFLDSTNIRSIADNCLDIVTKDALLLVGLQGGRIYDYQIDNGFHIDGVYDVVPFNHTNGFIYNVSYGIRAPADMFTLSPEEYPYPGSLVSDVSESAIGASFVNPNDQVFANVPKKRHFTILAPLCNRLGPNDPSIKGAAISCETDSTKNESIQEYIKQYIEQNIQDCINFTFKKALNYNVSPGKLSIEVLMGERDLIVSLVYPIEISVKNKPPITNYLDFNIRPKIRLKVLHEIASHLIGHDYHTIPTRADSNNIFFNILEDDPNDCYRGTELCILEGISVSKLKDYCFNHEHCNFSNGHYNYSDILVIEDSKSIIDGKPYRFQFAIENRRPALDFIDETSANKNSVLIVSPLGADPDEDELIYEYSIPNDISYDLLPPKDIELDIGDNDFEMGITVRDSEGLSDYQSVQIRVV